MSSIIAAITQEMKKKINAIETFNFDIKIGNPKKLKPSDDKPVINLCLYQVLPNPNYRNLLSYNQYNTYKDDNIKYQYEALDLYYLISLYDNKQNNIDYGLLEEIIKKFLQNPRLNEFTKHINKVEINMLTPNLQDLHDIWALFGAENFTTSIAYKVSCAIIITEKTEILELDEIHIKVKPQLE